uniref:TF-B3 domain-containing protein n=1 Tax=Opuntia streptacantha TaxID=393608 RepID=A0A7C9DEI0_OPUST
MKNTEERKSRRKRSHGSGDNSLPISRERKPWRFYKLMLSPSVQSKKLRIPEAFTRAFSDELSGAATATLTGPSGESWEVALVNEGDQLWFCKGWQEFVEHFSIGFAYFLLFLYEATLKFKVDIFSPTACEISYPCDAYNRKREPCYSNQSTERDSDNVNVVSTGASSRINDSDVELVALDGKDEAPLLGHEEPMSNNYDVVSDRSVGSLSASDDMVLDPDEGSTHSSKTNIADQGAPSGPLNNWLLLG